MRLTGKTRVLIVLFILLLGATIALGIFGLQGLMPKHGTVLIDFTGMKKKEAEAWRIDHRLAESQMTFSYSYDEDREEDTVLSQNRPKGTVLEKNDVLVLTVSNGKDPEKEVELPAFSAMSRSEIEAWAKDNGISNLFFAFAVDEDRPKDTVLGSEPAENTVMKRNQKIVITLSAGTKEESSAEIIVPDFSSYTPANLQAWGSSSRVSVSVQYQSSDTAERDTLLSQNPKAGTKISAGSSVSAVYSSDKGIVVQSFAGRSRAEAEAWISSNGLKAVFRQVYHALVQRGGIITQIPSSGSVPSGATITFEESAGLVPVQDYTGRSGSEFEAYLSDLNTRNNASASLTLSRSEEESTQAAGTILLQSPVGEVSPGSTISITIAVGKKAEVLNRAGMEEADFRTYLSGLGMKPGTISSAYHDSIGAGKIIRNDTGLYSVGSSISYTVSKGRFQWDYEDLIQPGKPWAELFTASREARANGWTVTKSDTESDTYEAGVISDCSVSGKTISCRVSTGRFVQVPDVLGKEKQEAIDLLIKAGLSPSDYETTTYRKEPKGTVIGQSIPPSAKVSYGSAISLSVSKGPKPAETAALPRFNLAFWDGETIEGIRSELTNIYHNAGFENLVFTVKDTSGGDNRSGIERITPAPDGSVIDKDTEITIVILSGK